MAGVSDIRRSNAQKLVAEGGGELKAFAVRLGRSEAQISAIVGSNPIRNIGHRLAREIERVFGKPPGWLDIDHSSTQYTRAAQEIAERFSSLPPERQQQLEGIIAAAIGYAVSDTSVARYLPPAPKNEPAKNGDS